MSQNARLHLRPAILPIENADPFAGDLIGRKKLRDFMSELVSNADDSFVLALDSPWGTGKTTFLKMWLEHLKSDGRASIYFNAWENDFMTDPLACLLGEIAHLSGSSGKPAAFKKAKQLGARLLKRAIPIGARLLSAGWIDEGTIKEAHDAISDLAEKVAEDAIAEYDKGKKLGAEFRAALEKAVASIAEETSGHKPLIFVIDELDRCRPTFAIELLERAKHFFTVPGVIFVLGVDKSALSRSLQTVYGVGFDSNAYLRRFIDFDLHLPTGKTFDFVRTQIQHFGLEEYRANVDMEMRRDGFLVSSLSSFFDAARISLRAQEQTIARLAVLSRVAAFHGIFPFAVVPLLTLIASEPELYNMFVGGSISGDDLLKRWTSGRPELGDLLLTDDQAKRFGIFVSVANAYLIGKSIKQLGREKYGENPELSDLADAHADFLWMARELHSKRQVQLFLKHLDLAAQIS